MGNDDIRQWGRNNGWEVKDEGRLPPGLRAAYDGRTGDSDPLITTVTETSVDEDTEVTQELPPVFPKTTVVERVKGLADRAKRNAPRTKTGRPSVRSIKARISTEKIISGAWAAAASLVTNLNPAVGRVLAMQAPVAGMVLEEKVKDTILDRVLQPLARAADGGNTAMALLGPPLLVQALTMRPDRAPQIVPMLRYALRSWIAVAGDKVVQVQQEEKKFEETYGQDIDNMIMFLVGPLLAENGYEFVPPTDAPPE